MANKMRGMIHSLEGEELGEREDGKGGDFLPPLGVLVLSLSHFTPPLQTPSGSRDR